MKRIAFLLSFIFLLVLNSCVSYEKFSIEVYKPSDLSFEPGIKKIALVARNLKYPNDTLQHYQVQNRHLIKDKFRFNTDSLAIKTCLDSLAARIAEQNQFDSIRVLPVNTFSVRHVNEIRPAKIEWYNSIADQSGANVLILLDMFSCFYTTNNENYVSVAKVITSNIWSVYQVNTHKIIDRFSQIDTLYWDETDKNGEYKKIRIPDKKNAILLAAGVIGENYAKHIFPAWTKVDRNFMTNSNSEIQKSIKLAQSNNWEKASEIWQALCQSGRKQDKVVALYNLALASEMNGDVDRAIESLNQAAKAGTGLFMSNVNEAIRRYIVILYQRKNELVKLNKQHEIR